jgi:multiple sugar transport system substrate-binding protein
MSIATASPRATRLAALAVFTALALAPAAALAQKLAPITVVINQSPWFGGFAKVVEAYEKETGNKVNLDVNPFAGSAEKQRNSVRAREGQFDLLVMNSSWLAEFYHGGFLAPLAEIG